MFDCFFSMSFMREIFECQYIHGLKRKRINKILKFFRKLLILSMSKRKKTTSTLENKLKKQTVLKLEDRGRKMSSLTS